MTKPIASVAVMMLWEEGRFRLTDPISRYIPAMKDMKVLTEKVDAAGHRATMLVPMEREITIQDLLRHTSGLNYGRGPSAAELKAADAGLKGDIGPKSPLLALTNAEVVARIAQAPLLFQPGTSWEYGRSTDVLGHLVELVSGTTLDRFFDERIFKPLGMTDTGFAVPKEKLDRLAHTATDPDTGKVPELWDPVGGRKFFGGGEGLVSTAADYVRFAQMMLNGGALGGTRLLARKTVEYMTSDHLGALAHGPTYAPGPGYGFGLGFAVRTATGMSGIPGSIGEYNWGGAAGTAFWVDPHEKLIAILMLQAPEQRLHYRYAFRSLVYQAIE
jgi:CubicO group peptidase (beta-lactamase class C family)